MCNLELRENIWFPRVWGSEPLNSRLFFCLSHSLKWLFEVNIILGDSFFSVLSPRHCDHLRHRDNKSSSLYTFQNGRYPLHFTQTSVKYIFVMFCRFLRKSVKINWLKFRWKVDEEDGHVLTRDFIEDQTHFWYLFTFSFLSLFFFVVVIV